MAGVEGKSGPPGNTNRRTHGGYSRLTALKGARFDRRRREWKAIATRMKEYSRSLGRSISPQKATLLREIATLEAVLLPPLDLYLAGAKIVKRGGKVDGAVELRLRLSTRLLELLQAVGLDRVRRTPSAPWQRRPPRRADKPVVEDRAGGPATAADEGRKSPARALLRFTPETGE